MDYEKVLNEMTLEEKVGLCSGKDFWNLKGIERLGIPSVMVSDGPHGLRKQDDKADHLGINESIKAVCFPTSCAVASSFDKNLIYAVGEALGDECQAENVSVILGPGVNIKRSPLCGRNFEYYSEDPYLTSKMASSIIKGIQSKNVGTSMKHFLANNQEYRRMTSSSNVDERTLREIYLAAFEGAVKEAEPWTIMCSYNQVNGVFASENYRYLTEILRNEWGFKGYVMSDWGAVNNRVDSLKAGMDLEMPSSNGSGDNKVVKAVKDGLMDENIVDTAALRILKIIDKFTSNRDSAAVFDRDAHHEQARKTASDSCVLLKNDGILPLDKKQKIAFIGKFAEAPRYQGSGSSYINSSKIVSALDAVAESDIGMANISYAKGFETDNDEIDDGLIAEAVETAKNASIAVVFAGLPAMYESEGYDREHMKLPESQNMLIKKIAEVQPNLVVVLHNGSPVEMPWISDIKGLLEVYLGGQAVGAATIDVLFGDVNPSGKLAETFPLKLEDNPSFLYFKGEKDTVEYREGIFVGYRYYDKKKIEVLFPFGYGLSYTNFEYSNMTISANKIKDTDKLIVTVDVKNTGNVFGKEIVQLYVAPKCSNIIRPVKELKGFDKVALDPQETKTVTFELDKRSFAYYNVGISDWHVETGDYAILIGKSSRDIVCEKELNVESTVLINEKLSLNSTLGDLNQHPEGKKILDDMLAKFNAATATDSDEADAESSMLGEGSQQMMAAMLNSMPIRGVINFGAIGGAEFTEENIINLLSKLNSEN